MNSDYLKKLLGKKNIEFYITIIIVCVVLIVATNTIFSDKSEASSTSNILNSSTVSSSKNNEEVQDEHLSNELATSLKKILEQIDGVGEAEVLVTYNSDDVLRGVKGVVVVATGATSENVKNSIKGAVQVAAGIGEHKIKVYRKAS